MMLESEARAMGYLAHALLHTLLHTHGRSEGGREREEFGEEKNVYVCKSSLEGGRGGGLYE